MVTYKGWKAHIMYRTGTDAYAKVGYSDSVTIDVATGLEPYYEHGNRRPVDLAEGNEEITGMISKAWINMNLFEYMLPSAGTTALTSFDLYLYMSPYAIGAPNMYVYGCKFESGSVDIPQDGFLMVDLDFRAEYLVYQEETAAGP